MISKVDDDYFTAVTHKTSVMSLLITAIEKFYLSKQEYDPSDAEEYFKQGANVLAQSVEVLKKAEDFVEKAHAGCKKLKRRFGTLLLDASGNADNYNHANYIMKWLVDIFNPIEKGTALYNFIASIYIYTNFISYRFCCLKRYFRRAC